MIQALEYLLPEQEKTGAIPSDHSEPPIDQGELMLTVNSIAAFQQGAVRCASVLDLSYSLHFSLFIFPLTIRLFFANMFGDQPQREFPSAAFGFLGGREPKMLGPKRKLYCSIPRYCDVEVNLALIWVLSGDDPRGYLLLTPLES